jgi:mannosyltransferase OCH1-like enzyme
MRSRILLFWILLIAVILFVIYITVIRRRSPQLFLTEQDVIEFMKKNNTNSTHRRRIPRLIHQTWKNSTIPPQWNRTVESVRKLNADQFEYRLWTDEDIHEFVRENEPELYINTFLTYWHDIQRIDAFRYVLLYHLGGVYIDMDTGCSKPLNILLDILETLDPQSEHLVGLPATQPNGVSNDFMISTKGHPLFRQLISRLSLFNHNYILYTLTVMLSAGPPYLTLNAHLFDTSSQTASVRIIEWKVYNGLFLWFKNGSTWHRKETKIIGYIYSFLRDYLPHRLWLYFLVFIFIIIFTYLCWRRRFIIRKMR